MKLYFFHCSVFLYMAMLTWDNLLQKLLAAYFCDARISVKYCKWTHSAEHKHVCVVTTGCIGALPHKWGTESICHVCLLLHSLYFFMLRKMTRDAVISRTQKVILLTAGLSDVMTSCGPIQNATWHLLATTCHIPLLPSIRKCSRQHKCKDIKYLRQIFQDFLGV
jgi:hypothetical protein